MGRGLDALGPERSPVVEDLLLPSVLISRPGQTRLLLPGLQDVGVGVARLLERFG